MFAFNFPICGLSQLNFNLSVPGLLFGLLSFTAFIRLSSYLSIHWQAREDGPHQPRVERDVELGDLKLPPGVVAGLGFPERASPFVQARLPVGMKYEGKASRCVSFRSADCPFARGTRK